MTDSQQENEGTLQDDASYSHYTIVIFLPQADVKQIQVQATSLETINDIKQSLIDLPSTNQFTCFHLEHKGVLLNDFIELGSIEGLSEQPEFRLVQSPYTERESRLHLIRVLDGLAGGTSSPVSGGETNFASLQLAEHSDAPCVEEDITSSATVESLAVHDSFSLPSCCKSIALSVWNPPSNENKARGHLLYLVFNTLEGDSIHITSSVSGYTATNSTAAKFDASQKAGSKSYHSLLPLLQSLSPLFKKNHALLEKQAGSRDLIFTAPIINAQPAQPWIAMRKEHKPDPVRVQRSYLEHGLENNDTLRDWNEELQTTKELPATPLPDRIMRCRLLQKTLYDFSAAAAKGAELLVKGELVPLNPTEHPDAQMYIYSNIFFSRGLDGVGTFLREGGDAAAHKAVALDVNGVRILSTLDVDGLSTLGTCVVDFAGQRIVAQTIVPGIFRQRPENESQIIYGGVDGRDVVATDSKCEETFSKVSAALRLRRHAVYEKDGTRKELELSIEVKGLAGADGRTYILDLYRITPVDIEFLEHECVSPNEADFVSPDSSLVTIDGESSTKYPHRMTLLRYELMEAYWEAKLNRYVEQKLAEEDANKTAKQTILEDERSAKESQNGETDHQQPTELNTASGAADQVVEPSGAQNENIDTMPDSRERRVDITGFSLLFNPDTFHARTADSAGEDDIRQRELDEALIRDVSRFLRDTTIPAFLDDLKEARVATPLDSTSLAKALHKRGINIRYLGKLLQLAQADSQSAKCAALITVTQRDIVARSIKHVLSAITKGLPYPLMSPALSHFLNNYFSDKPSPAILEKDTELLYPQNLDFKKLTPDTVRAAIEKQALCRFRYSLSDHWQAECRDLPMLREICLQFGIQICARDYFAPVEVTNGHSHASDHRLTQNGTSKKGRKHKKESSPVEHIEPRTTMFIPEDILSILPRVKSSLPRSGLAEEAMEAGRVCIVQGQRDLGAELLMESLSLHEQIYGVLHPEAARGYNALALIYSGLEDKIKALELARKAVIVAERTLGLDHSETILYYLNLALFEHNNGHTKQALQYLQYALKRWRTIFGADHPDMITTINNVAVMLQSLKLYTESLKWFQSSVGICEAVYGSESVNAATLYFQIAQATALTGDHKSSINRMRDSYNIFKKEFGEDNPNTKETHLWLTQLTQSAVHLAKQAKIESSRRGPKTGTGKGPKEKVLTHQSTVFQNQNNIAATPAEEHIGSKGLQSIEELVNYISGDDKVKESKAKSRKTSK